MSTHKHRIAIFILFLTSIASQAEVISNPINGASLGAQSGKIATTTTTVDLEPVSNLRCWQEGKLLFDENNVTISEKNLQQKTVEFERQTQKNTKPLILIEIGSATCLYKSI